MALPGGNPSVNIERLSYWVPDGLAGKVLNNEKELKKLLQPHFPNEEIKKDRRKASGFDFGGYDYFYLEDNKGRHDTNVAYHCHSCEKIVIGAPRVESYDNISFLAGDKGVKIYCGNCNFELYKSVEAVS